jgi:tripartite-type tricarboxylate transporter receptor subunit TctC
MKKTFTSLIICLTAASACAQTYPAKPIHFVVGFPAGSSIDNISRTVLDQIRLQTNATIMVENKPGALGSIGAEAVAKSAPDGYTLMPSSSATNSSGPHLMQSLQKLDLDNKLTHIGRMVKFDIAVVTNASSFGDAKALIDRARAKPGDLTYGYGSGTGQVAAAVFSDAAKIEARGIPYKGQPLAVTDLLGGQIDFVAADLGALLPQISAKKLNPIAVMSDKRSGLLPEVPTTLELGLANAQLAGWIGVSGPIGLKPEAAKWWEEQLQAALQSSEVREKIRNQGMEVDPLFSEAFKSFVSHQYQLWGRYVTNAKIQPQ